MKPKKLYDCALIGVCAVTRSNVVYCYYRLKPQANSVTKDIFLLFFS